MFVVKLIKITDNFDNNKLLAMDNYYNYINLGLLYP